MHPHLLSTGVSALAHALVPCKVQPADRLPSPNGCPKEKTPPARGL
ncbi:putative lipoprotein [Burkholderia thailandensis]|uniref:Lipoprotein n=1 Tax=Burkholderia thailandensis TaxID=57975 RepID=A0AAW9CZ79_BURTH|nr:putative lipoprotein [Burkholderia thailandensis]MDW9254413.1 putative lipoprotein [Burkholderia thailandensis]